MFALLLAPYGPGFCKHQLCFLEAGPAFIFLAPLLEGGIEGLRPKLSGAPCKPFLTAVRTKGGVLWLAPGVPTVGPSYLES